MIIGVLKETAPNEKRVALAPASLNSLIKQGCEIHVESDAGKSAGYTDQQYADKGAKIVTDRQQIIATAGLLAMVGAGPNAQFDDLREGQVVVGLCDPLTHPQHVQTVAARQITLCSMELIPRITRAQSMDVLSSQASLAGYKAVLIAASALGRIFPMMMTAAGTLTPAKVFVVGAGVAGLQAIATAKRLGAVVHAIDVRPAVKQQVESLGAKFVAPEDLAEGEGGYATELTAEQRERQQQLMAEVIRESDVVITTAAIPGRPAPKLVSTQMVESMAPGSVIVDLAAERGGNCELTRSGETVDHHGVSILGPENVPSMLAHHASQTYGKNMATYLDHLMEGDDLNFAADDEIAQETLICHNGEILQPRVRELLNLEPLAPKAAEATEADASSSTTTAGTADIAPHHGGDTPQTDRPKPDRATPPPPKPHSVSAPSEPEDPASAEHRGDESAASTSDAGSDQPPTNPNTDTEKDH